MEHSSESDSQTLRDFLDGYRGARVFHPPLVDDKGELVGNNGDRLMVIGTDIVYHDLGITRVEDLEQADLCVLGANGGMLEKAIHIPRMFRTLSQDYPRTPLWCPSGERA